jgi:prolyl oligopeptidase
MKNLPLFLSLIFSTFSYSTTCEDPFLWLEERNSAQSLDWVKEHSHKTTSAIEALPLFGDIHRDLEAIGLAKDKLPQLSAMGKLFVNFWTDADHLRGLLRVASQESVLAGQAEWKVVLDIDALNKKENKSWVYKGISCFDPEIRKNCLITLSDKGSDTAEVREFDMETMEFVSNGFYLPPAKSDISWLDIDTLLVATDFGEGSLTKSGYPRQVKLLKRGQALQEASLISEVPEDFLAIQPFRQKTPSGYRHFLIKAKDFYTFEYFSLSEKFELSKLPMPEGSEFSAVFGEHVLIKTRNEFDLNGRKIKSGSILAYLLTDIQDPKYEVVFEAEAMQAFSEISLTQNTIYISYLDNVNGRLKAIERKEGAWLTRNIPVPDLSEVGVNSDSESNLAIISYSNQITVYTEELIRDGQEKGVFFRKSQERFNSKDMVVEQHFATSKDGTKVPYYLTYKRGIKSPRATILYGYGGFMISETPHYSADFGKAWLERGGVLVHGNIRGGGEYGPEWHKAALLGKRQNAYDDFAAIAEDLISNKITTPNKLAIMGGSNGGLLVSTVGVQRPELFSVVISQVPLTDMLRYHLLPAGDSWVAEYGDPENPEHRAWLERYSPYQNAKDGVRYPHFFFLTSTADDRVHPAHARKLAAKLEELGNPVSYYENTEGGHGGAADIKQRAYFWSLQFAFLADKLGL